MRIYFDNVNFSSPSGPNSFAKKLADQLSTRHHIMTSYQEETPDVQLAFIYTTKKVAPIVQRLDGIYFNSAQDWESQNEVIEQTFSLADGVVYQSYFNKKLTERFFGKKENHRVIHNGTNTEFIKRVPELSHPIFENFNKVWCCASSWRPHKRLEENIRYFLECATDDDCLVVAGDVPNPPVEHPRIFYAGNMNWVSLISLYKKSDFFIHLAFLDHCPNVVVDARASGCKIVCSASGGTKEIAGPDATVVQDLEWDFRPIRLYEPPLLQFDKIEPTVEGVSIDIKVVAQEYESFLEAVL